MLALIVGREMKLALIGVVVALALTRIMGSLLYETSPADPLTFASISIVLFGFALLACWLPARRATKVNPTETLSHE